MLKIILLIVVLLAGCATPAEMRTSVPVLQLTSSRPAKVVALCMADRWENTTVGGGGYPITMRPISDGYMVSVMMHSMVKTWRSQFADINDTPSGSTTRYYKSSAMGGSSDAYDNAVKECQ